MFLKTKRKQKQLIQRPPPKDQRPPPKNQRPPPRDQRPPLKTQRPPLIEFVSFLSLRVKDVKTEESVGSTGRKSCPQEEEDDEDDDEDEDDG